jgi:hypothetical protein
MYMDKTKKERKIPRRYVPKSLSEADKKKQLKSIQSKTYEDRPKLKTFKSKKSKQTEAFDKKYGDRLKKMKGGKSKANISKLTAIPVRALNEVYDRGLRAYKESGSRPNQTANSWATARMYSYIMGIGGSRKFDKDITKKYKVKFKD